MNESEQSSWAPPTEKPKTPQGHLEARYSDRADPDDIDDMVMLPGEVVPAVEADPFGVGREIVIRRGANKETGAPAYNEAGWKIVDAHLQKEVEPGKFIKGVVVEKKQPDGRTASKEVPMYQVYELNPLAPELGEGEPLSVEETKLADEAIEEAIGLENPEELDPTVADTGKINHSELRGMREAAEAAARLEAETSEREALAELDRQIEAENVALNVLVESFPQDQKNAIWQYAVGALANKENEMNYALRKLPDGFQKQYPGILSQYADGFKKLHALRDKRYPK